jgi:CRP-like cAMP-binding protein
LLEPEPAASFAADSPAADQPTPEPAADRPKPALEPIPAPELTASPEPAAPEPESEAPFYLGALEASGELSDEQRKALFQSVTIESIAADEELKVTGLALVIDGLVSVQATVSDVSAGTLKSGEAIYAKSSIPDTMTLRLVAEADPTKVALWDLDAVDAALAGSSALLEGLMQASNRIQAIAGCTMGPLGDRLDEGLRTSAIERLEVRVLQPNEVVATAGLPVPGMIILGVGTVELDEDGQRLGPGDFLFAREVLGGESAPATARAGAKGAIIFFGARALAQELLVTCPPLLEIFAGM